MSNIKQILVSILALIYFLLLQSQPAFAESYEVLGRCKNISITSDTGNKVFDDSLNMFFKLEVSDPGNYKVTIDDKNPPYKRLWPNYQIENINDKIVGSFNQLYIQTYGFGSHELVIKSNNFDYCRIPYFVYVSEKISPTPDNRYEYPNCRIELFSNEDNKTGMKFTDKTKIFIKIYAPNAYKTGRHRIVIRPDANDCEYGDFLIDDLPGTTGYKALGLCNIGSHTIVLQENSTSKGRKYEDTDCKTNFDITEEGTEVTPILPECTNAGKTIEEICQLKACKNLPECKKTDQSKQLKPREICKKIEESKKQCKGKENEDECIIDKENQYISCMVCFRDEDYNCNDVGGNLKVRCDKRKKSAPGAWTAIGCIPTDAAGFVGFILGPMIGIAGGIAFLLILGGGFQILFSRGDPEAISAGKERITGAIAGLLVIIFSVLILKVIGVDILDLPGFDGKGEDLPSKSEPENGTSGGGKSGFE